MDSSDSSDSEEIHNFHFWNNWKPIKVDSASSNFLVKTRNLPSKFVFKRNGNWLPPSNFERNEKYTCAVSESLEKSVNTSKHANVGCGSNINFLNEDWGLRSIGGGNIFANSDEEEKVWDTLSRGSFSIFKISVNPYGNIVASASGEIRKERDNAYIYVTTTSPVHVRILLGLNSEEWYSGPQVTREVKKTMTWRWTSLPWASRTEGGGPLTEVVEQAIEKKKKEELGVHLVGAAISEAVNLTTSSLHYDGSRPRDIRKMLPLNKLWELLCLRRHCLPTLSIRLRRAGVHKNTQHLKIIPKYSIEHIREFDGKEIE